MTSAGDSFPNMTRPSLYNFFLTVPSYLIPSISLLERQYFIHISQSTEKRGSRSDYCICHQKLQSVNDVGDPLLFFFFFF